VIKTFFIETFFKKKKRKTKKKEAIEFQLPLFLKNIENKY